MTNAQHTPGPYWIRTVTNGEHHVCGRNAKIVARYMPHQMAMADAHLRRLQKAHVETVAAAEDDLLGEALEALSGIKWRSDDKDNMEFAARITYSQMDRIRALLTKAGKDGQ